MGKLLVTFFAICSCTVTAFVMLVNLDARLRTPSKSHTGTTFWLRSSLRRDTAPVAASQICNTARFVLPTQFVPRHTEVAYNVQTTVDAKNNIPIDYKVTNQNDSKAMGNMVQRAKSILRTNDFTVLYDKGFHTGSELKIAQEIGVETIVAIPGVPCTSQAPNHEYNYEHFMYDETADTYTCPQDQVLRTNGTWNKELTSSGNIIRLVQTIQDTIM